MKLTLEILKAMKNCDARVDCDGCVADGCFKFSECFTIEAIDMIIELVESTENTVWQGAEDYETFATVHFGTDLLMDAIRRKTYTRQPIKSKNMLIAEELCQVLFDDINPANIKTILSVLDKKDIK